MRFCCQDPKNVLDISAIASTIQPLQQFAQSKEVSLYLVGGSVRDLLLARPTTDLDFALAENAITIAQDFARTIDATCIQLETDPPTARIISGRSTPPQIYDLAQFRGQDLEADLRLRDLTINAMAYNLDRQNLIDPCGGQQDLAAKILRFPARQVVVDDPLRMLRLFRFAAQLEFQIDPASLSLVSQLSDTLSLSATERIRDEFLKMMTVNQSVPILEIMQNIGLLQQILKTDFEVAKKKISFFEQQPVPDQLDQYLQQAEGLSVEDYLTHEVVAGLNRSTLIKLSLLSPAEDWKRLLLGRKAEQLLSNWKLGFQQFPSLDQDPTPLLRTLRCEWIGVITQYFATVQAEAEREASTSITDFEQIALSIGVCYYEKVLPILKRGSLLTGKSLIQIFRISEGPQIGRILTYLDHLQFAGLIRTQDEACQAVSKYLSQQSSIQNGNRDQ